MNQAFPFCTRHGWPRARALAALVLVGALTWPSAQAQLGTPAATTSASVPQSAPPVRPAPGLTSPMDAQRSMDLNNEQAGGKVVPQVRIPLGKNAGAPVFERRRSAAPAASAPVTTIDDAAARCEAESDKRARTACRSRTGKS